MWETLLGGALAIAGGWGATWYQARKARKIRMDEVIAERKVEVNAEAHSRMKRIEGSFLQQNLEDTLNLVMSHEQWLFDSYLFLPGRFGDHWLRIRNDLHKLVRWQGIKPPDELTALDKQIEASISAAIDEIYKDTGLPRLDVRNP